ncbi:FtsX-like permease family protein [Kitasatospora sp. NPDC056181]|uniref:ABC transporter permease n=1 Tax=Kitasatospora sp. NPDC056181 TaxID=3345737 RepID=UPI0035D63D79
MKGVGRVVRSGVRRRRVQTVVIVLATMIAVTASVLGGSLLVASGAPFDRAFAAQRGAHLTAEFDAALATGPQLRETARAAGVTAAAGPFRTTTVDPQADVDLPAGMSLPPLRIVARADPDGPVDRVTLLRGSWPAGPGQIVLSVDYDSPVGELGTVLRLPGLPGGPALTVVGFARSVGRSGDGWVAPSGITALTGPGTTGGYQMLYRFAAADTEARIAADRAALTAATPAGALRGTQSWLTTKQGSDRNTALFVPLLIAFGLLGVLMSLLIVGVVVAGAVGTATRRIGILKAVGFTPAQVVRSYVGQALIPAAAGTALGVVAGNALAVPVLSATAQVYGTTGTVVAPWVDLAVMTGALGLAALTAWAVALRAGRLRTVDALAVGRTTRGGHGRRVTRLTARLPLPGPLALGLALPFARPARAAGMLAAIVFGTAATTFAVGITATTNWVQAAKNHDSGDVAVHLLPRPGTSSPTSDPATLATAVERAVNGRAETGSYYSVGQTEVTVAGVAGTTRVFAFDGDASGAGYRMVSGRWFRSPGEAVAPSTFLTAAGARVGDTVRLEDHGRTVPVRIVGEVFDPHAQTNEVLAHAATFTDVVPRGYYVTVRQGSDVARYLDGLSAELTPLGATVETGRATGSSDVIAVLDTLTALLTLMLVAVAGLGVLNTVVLDTHERVREIGIAKALGMTPGQTVAMVMASVTPGGLAGGAIGLLAGVALHAVTAPAMGHHAGLHLPGPAVHVFPAAELVMLGAGGLVIAVAGALLPAVRAARARTVTALRTE